MGVRCFHIHILKLIIAAECAFGFAFTVAGGAALPFVSPVFGDNMVLQRGKTNMIWGWTKPGQVVRVEIGGRTGTAVAASDGRWQVQITPPPPGGPYIVKIDGPESVELHGVLVGDVWLCGGQSNMYLGLSAVRDGADEVKSANHPEIRLYIVQQHVSYSPTAVPQGTWKICSPETVAQGGAGGFSAVAYFFGRKLQDELHVPIGLIEDCVGGTPAETWMSPETLHKLGDLTRRWLRSNAAGLKARRNTATTSCIGTTSMMWDRKATLGPPRAWMIPAGRRCGFLAVFRIWE